MKQLTISATLAVVSVVMLLTSVDPVTGSAPAPGKTGTADPKGEGRLQNNARAHIEHTPSLAYLSVLQIVAVPVPPPAGSHPFTFAARTFMPVR